MPSPNDLRRLYPAIGEFMIRYATVQAVLRTSLLTLMNVDGHGGRALLYGMSDDVVLKKLKIAVAGHGTRYSEIMKIVAPLSEIAHLRNQLVHWVPFTNPARTTLEAFVDAYKNYKNPNQPQVICTPAEIRRLTNWLRLLEWDINVLILAVRNRERFDKSMLRPTLPEFAPKVPKAAYPTNGPKGQSGEDAEIAGRVLMQSTITKGKKKGNNTTE